MVFTTQATTAADIPPLAACEFCYLANPAGHREGLPEFPGESSNRADRAQLWGYLLSEPMPKTGWGLVAESLALKLCGLDERQVTDAASFFWKVFAKAEVRNEDASFSSRDSYSAEQARVTLRFALLRTLQNVSAIALGRVDCNPEGRSAATNFLSVLDSTLPCSQTGPQVIAVQHQIQAAVATMERFWDELYRYQEMNAAPAELCESLSNAAEALRRDFSRHCGASAQEVSEILPAFTRIGQFLANRIHSLGEGGWIQELREVRSLFLWARGIESTAERIAHAQTDLARKLFELG
jgi:hypothetical protein